MAKPPAKRTPPAKAGDEEPAYYTRIAREYCETAQEQREFFLQLAERIEAGEDFEHEAERALAAGAIRAFAKSIPSEPPGKAGAKAKFDHAAEALCYAAYRRRGLEHGQALALIADRLGLSEQAIEKAICKHRKDAFAFFGMEDPGNRVQRGRKQPSKE